MRDARPSRSGWELRLGLAAAAASAAVLISGVLESPASESAPGAGHRRAGRNDAVSVAVPPGWQRARARLVPDLLMPREVVSLGTFPMPVGGGGSCGREPVAAIRRMRDGDALITVQEYVVTADMRAHLRRSYPPLENGIRVGRIDRSAPPAGPGRSISHATVSFSEHGRAFDALVYLAGRPAPALRRLAARVLEGLQIGRRT